MSSSSLSEAASTSLSSIVASVPEPAPRERGEAVTPALLAWLDARATTPGALELAVLVCERDAFGRAKYGQPLMSEDGRNTLARNWAISRSTRTRHA